MLTINNGPSKYQLLSFINYIIVCSIKGAICKNWPAVVIMLTTNGRQRNGYLLLPEVAIS